MCDKKQCTQNVYKSTNQNAVPIYQTQATFPIHKKTSYQTTRSQSPLTLAWAVTIHKYSRADTTWNFHRYDTCKRQVQTWRAYVAFSRVRTIEKLCIINNTQNQIHVSEYVEEEMKRLRKNILSQMPSNLFHTVPGGVKLLHINIGIF